MLVMKLECGVHPILPGAGGGGEQLLSTCCLRGQDYRRGVSLAPVSQISGSLSFGLQLTEGGACAAGDEWGTCTFVQMGSRARTRLTLKSPVDIGRNMTVCVIGGFCLAGVPWWRSL